MHIKRDKVNKKNEREEREKSCIKDMLPWRHTSSQPFKMMNQNCMKTLVNSHIVYYIGVHNLRLYGSCINFQCSWIEQKFK